MAVRKLRNSWYVDIRSNRQRRRLKSPENSRTGALAYEAVLRQKLARDESIDKPDHAADAAQTFEQFAQKWFEEYVVPNNKQQEQRMKTYILRSSLIPFFGKLPVGQITTHHVEQYKAQALKKGASKKTVNNRLAVLGKCIRTAYEWFRFPGTPPKITLLKCDPPSTNHLSADECELLLSNATGVIREMILTALRTGMRQGEIRGLQWSSINWENRTITVRHSLNDRLHVLESPKSNRERHIPMDVDVYEALFRRKKETGYVFLAEGNTPFDSQRIIRQLNKVREKAGLKKFTWHSLRHTFATQLGMRGAPLHIVQKLLGHSTILMTMRYAHVDEGGLRAVIALLNPKQALNANHGQPVGNQWIEAMQQETRNAYSAR